MVLVNTMYIIYLLHCSICIMLIIYIHAHSVKYFCFTTVHYSLATQKSTCTNKFPFAHICTHLHTYGSMGKHNKTICYRMCKFFIHHYVKVLRCHLLCLPHKNTSKKHSPNILSREMSETFRSQHISYAYSYFLLQCYFL